MDRVGGAVHTLDYGQVPRKDRCDVRMGCEKSVARGSGAGMKLIEVFLSNLLGTQVNLVAFDPTHVTNPFSRRSRSGAIATLAAALR
jgi:hypothetical protein